MVHQRYVSVTVDFSYIWTLHVVWTCMESIAGAPYAHAIMLRTFAFWSEIGVSTLRETVAHSDSSVNIRATHNVQTQLKSTSFLVSVLCNGGSCFLARALANVYHCRALIALRKMRLPSRVGPFYTPHPHLIIDVKTKLLTRATQTHVRCVMHNVCQSGQVCFKQFEEYLLNWSTKSILV